MLNILAQIDVTKLTEKPAIPLDAALGQVLSAFLWIVGMIAVGIFVYYMKIKPMNDERMEKYKFEHEKFILEKKKEIQDQIDLRFKAEQENKEIRAKYYAEGYNNMVKVLEKNTDAVEVMCVRAAECKEANYDAMETFSENNQKIVTCLNDLTKEIAILSSKNGKVNKDVYEREST